MWPKNVGIKAIEVYFPAQYVDETELEEFDGVSTGKYTVGLGQSKMAFCTDLEDSQSMCLTVVQHLIAKYGIDPKDIGKLDVGTETIVDKSKSIKTTLMQLFERNGCTDIEGVDSYNACYGLTAVLLNAISWVESSAWDGRLAMVVGADIAVYDTPSARPTGGAGAIAMIVGPDAPLVFERGLRGSCMRNVYDFYKPNLSSQYPVINGVQSVECYLNALDECYRRYGEKALKKNGESVSLDSFDSFVFHTPYCKLTQKSLARLALLDFLKTPKDKLPARYSGVEQYHGLNPEDTYYNKDVEKAFMTVSKPDFEKKTLPSLYIANRVGNMYTPSVYAGLVSLLISKPADQLAGSRVGVFSYGSGLCSTMYSLVITKDSKEGSDLVKIVSVLSSVKQRLEARTRVAPEEYTKIVNAREEHYVTRPYVPQSSTKDLFPGTYYLLQIDDKGRRSYDRVKDSQ